VAALLGGYIGLEKPQNRFVMTFLPKLPSKVAARPFIFLDVLVAYV
jgi:hypothetical protein